MEIALIGNLLHLAMPFLFKIHITSYLHYFDMKNIGGHYRRFTARMALFAQDQNDGIHVFYMRIDPQLENDG